MAKIGTTYKGKIRVKHLVEVLRDDVGLKQIESRVKRPLKSVYVAVHYRCHFLKPSEIRQQRSAERPTVLDDLVRTLGAQSDDYQDKMMCCGAGGKSSEVRCNT